jgi:hypothetical protein
VSQHRLNIRDPYISINLILAVVIIMIFIYSGIFSPEENNYPVACVHETLTGEPCISCGLSHSFSLIIRGRIDEAYQWNLYGIRVFLFFALQLILRIYFSVLHAVNPSTGKQLIIMDSIVSGIMFLVAFWPFIRYLGP